MTYEKFVENATLHIMNTAAAAIQSVTDEVANLSKTNNNIATLNLTKINNVAKKAVKDLEAAFISGNQNIAGIIESEIVKAELMKENAELQLNTKIEQALAEIDGILNSGRSILEKDVADFINANNGVLVVAGNEQAVRIRLEGDELEQKLRALLSLSASGGKAVSVGDLTETDIARRQNYKIFVQDKPTLSLVYPSIVDSVNNLKPTQMTDNTVFVNNTYKDNTTIVATITESTMDLSTLTYTDLGNATYLETPEHKFLAKGDKVYRDGAILLDVTLDLTHVVKMVKFKDVTWDDRLCKEITEYGLVVECTSVSVPNIPNTPVSTNQYGKISNVLTINYPHQGKLSGATNIVKGNIYESEDGKTYLAKADVSWDGSGIATIDSFILLSASTLFNNLINV